MPAPARPLRRDPLQQLQVGERAACAAAPRAAAPRSRRPARRRPAAAASHHGRRRSRQAHRLTGTAGPARACGPATNRTTSASQSRSVRSTRCAAPARRSAAATSSRCAAAAAANSRRSSAGGLHLALLAGLRVGQHDQCRRRAAPARAGRAPRRRAGRAGPDSARSGRSQSASPRKSEITTASPRRRGGRRSCSSAAARSPRCRSAARGVAATRAQQVRGRAPGRRGPGSASVCSPVATTAPIRLPPPRGQVRDRGQPRRRTRSRFSQPAVPKSRLARQVDHHPGLQLAVGDGLPDVRLGGAGGDRPVHPPDVVAGVVRPAPPPARCPGRAPGRGGCPAAARPAGAGRSAPACADAASSRRRPRIGRRHGGPRWRRRGHRSAPASDRAGCGRRATWRTGADLRQRHGLQHPGDDVVDRDAVGQRVVGQHQPVPQHVRRDVEDVLRQHVVAAADQRQRAGRGDDAERGPRRRAVGRPSRRRRPGRARPGCGWRPPAGRRSRPARGARTRWRPRSAAGPARRVGSTCCGDRRRRRPSGRRSRAPPRAPGSPTSILNRKRSRCASGSG